MHTENRTEGSKLEPANEQLAVRRIVGIPTDKPANVGRPVGKTGKFKVQTRRDLPLKGDPVGIDIARPGCTRIPLASRKRRPREDEHTFLIPRSTLSLIHG